MRNSKRHYYKCVRCKRFMSIKTSNRPCRSIISKNCEFPFANGFIYAPYMPLKQNYDFSEFKDKIVKSIKARPMSINDQLYFKATFQNDFDLNY